MRFAIPVLAAFVSSPAFAAPVIQLTCSGAGYAEIRSTVNYRGTSNVLLVSSADSQKRIVVAASTTAPTNGKAQGSIQFELNWEEPFSGWMKRLIVEVDATFGAGTGTLTDFPLGTTPPAPLKLKCSMRKFTVYHSSI